MVVWYELFKKIPVFQRYPTFPTISILSLFFTSCYPQWGSWPDAVLITAPLLRPPQSLSFPNNLSWLLCPVALLESFTWLTDLDQSMAPEIRHVAPRLLLLLYLSHLHLSLEKRNEGYVYLHIRSPVFGIFKAGGLSCYSLGNVLNEHFFPILTF